MCSDATQQCLITAATLGLQHAGCLSCACTGYNADFFFLASVTECLLILCPANVSLHAVWCLLLAAVHYAMHSCCCLHVQCPTFLHIPVWGELLIMPSLFLKDSAGCVLPFYITAQFVVCRISVCVLLVLMQLCTQLLLQQAATLLRNRTMAGTCCVGAPVVPDRSAWCSVEFCVLPVLLSCPHLALSVETKIGIPFR